MVCQCLITLLGWVALLYLSYRLYRIFYDIFYVFFIATPLDLKKAAGGKWAVVTGSTDGIGKGYAFELAHKGFSIVLISRSPSKLDMVREQLVRETNAQVKTIAFDFTSANVDEYENKILSHLRALDVGILVNNVGVSFDYPEVLHKNAGGLKKMADVEIVNTLGVTLLSAGILPQMVKRNSGIIVNVSSSACYTTLKMGNIYGSTKAYVSWLTRIMQKEYANTNIIIQLVCPMVVVTNMTHELDKFRPSIFNANVDYYAQSAVRSIGIASETTGCAMHQMQMLFLRALPERFLDSFVEQSSIKYRNIIMQRHGSKKAQE